MSEELREFFFMRDEQVVRIIIYYGFLFPLSIIAMFLFLYNRAQEKRIKYEREKQRELTNLKGRSNGVKHKVYE